MIRLLVGLAIANLALVSSVAGGEYFVGASVGQASLEVGSQDESDEAYSVRTGFRARYFGVEGGYFNLGEFRFTSLVLPATIEAEGFSAFVVGIAPIRQRFELFAKAGYVFLDVAGDRLDGNDENFSWGLGVGVNPGKRLRLRAEWETIDTDGIHDLELYTFGLDLRY